MIIDPVSFIPRAVVQGIPLLYGSTGGTSAVRTEYTYGDYGNVTGIKQIPLRNGTADDDMTLSADIEWDDSKSRYLHSLPISIEVRGGDGTLLRKRTDHQEHILRN